MGEITKEKSDRFTTAKNYDNGFFKKIHTHNMKELKDKCLNGQRYF